MLQATGFSPEFNLTTVPGDGEGPVPSLPLLTWGIVKLTCHYIGSLITPTPSLRPPQALKVAVRLQLMSVYSALV